MPRETTKNWRWKRLIKSAAKYVCAKGSIRTKAPNASTRIEFCCPKGLRHWNAQTKRCRVGTVAIREGKRKTR
jgi:hypothetical protein